MRGSVPRYLGVLGLLGALALGSLGGAAESSAAAACIPPGEGPDVCLEVSHTPEGPTVSAAGTARYVSFDATVTNNAKNAVTHATLDIAPVAAGLGADFSFFKQASPSAGSCSYTAATETIRCLLGKLRSGASADVHVVVRTPTEAGEAPLEFVTTVDEGPSDQNPNPGKVDSVAVTEVVDVGAGGSSAVTYVPEDTGIDLSVQQGSRRDALSLPPQPFATTAELEFTSTAELPFTCPAGFVCRIGGAPWLSATIPGTFDPVAEFDFFWPTSQVSSKQSTRNFVLFYLASPGAPLEIISARCSASLQVVPCLKDIVLPNSGPLKGTLSATLVTDHNGRMH
ncbi:MAG: hypothetical protein ACRDMU_06920 [Gaiellaceae bacterium]